MKDNPFIADFQFFKSRFQKKYKEAKIASRAFADNLEKLARQMQKKDKISGEDSHDIEKHQSNANLSRKILARDMIGQTTAMQKSIDELAEILDQLHKSQSSDGKDKKSNQ